MSSGGLSLLTRSSSSALKYAMYSGRMYSSTYSSASGSPDMPIMFMFFQFRSVSTSSTGAPSITRNVMLG